MPDPLVEWWQKENCCSSYKKHVVHVGCFVPDLVVDLEIDRVKVGDRGTGGLLEEPRGVSVRKRGEEGNGACLGESRASQALLVAEGWEREGEGRAVGERSGRYICEGKKGERAWATLRQSQEQRKEDKFVVFEGRNGKGV